MRTSNNMIEAVVKEVAGEDVIPLVNYLKDHKNISEFKIAEVLKREVNETRNMLYRLYDHNLVTFMRKKDKKKGWYIYYWTFNIKTVRYLTMSLKEKRLKRLKERLDREQEGNFFGCRNKCIRLSFDQSTDFSFKCPECGSVLDQEDNGKIIGDIVEEMQRLEKELKEHAEISPVELAEEALEENPVSKNKTPVKPKKTKVVILKKVVKQKPKKKKR